MMEDLPTTSSFLREGEVGNQSTDGCIPLVQVRKVPEPTEFLSHVCTKPLSELSRIRVSQLRVNETSTGFYLLLRTLEPTAMGTVKNDFGRNALVHVEDHVKNRILCCLYGYVHLRSETELKEFLPANTVFALKEPLLIACSEEQFAVVVGSPTDFVVVGRSHVLSNDAEVLGWREKEEDGGLQLTRKWMVIGHDMFQKGKFYDASDAYLFALNNCTENYMKLPLNKNLAESFLAQECYESAVKHALDVLEVQPLDEMALYYAGRAHYELREYRTARFYFQTLNRVIPSNKNYFDQLVRCEERLREAEGHVDVFKLYRACLTDVTETIDHGSFWRNIEFRPSSGNVRGVFATQDMEPGTLILVEKAVVTCFESSSEPGAVHFMRTAFRAVFKNPKTLGQKLSSLPFGCNATDGYRSRIFGDEVNELDPIVDVPRLYKILLRNVFNSKNSMAENPPVAYHIYEKVSRFRHSCLSNCSFLAYKDVVAVRTCAPVLKGEELFVRYYSNHLPFPEKQKLFKRRGFTCSCSLCALDEKDSPKYHDLRQVLKKTFDAEMALGAGVNLPSGERLLTMVSELELSYRKRDSLHLLLFIVYHEMAKGVDRGSEEWKEKVTFYVERGLQSVGLSTDFLLSRAEMVNLEIPNFQLMPEVLFDFAGLMAEKEYLSGRGDLAEKWVKIILLLERIHRGGNTEMVKQRFLQFKLVPCLLSLYA